MHCQQKVVEVKAELELELQQRNANVLTRRGSDNQVDDNYVAIASELQLREGNGRNVTPIAITASQIQNESSQTRARIVSASSEAMSVNSPASSDMKVSKNAAPKIALKSNEPEKVVNKDEPRKGIKVEKMHLSCRSDTYEDGREYAGVIIYQYNGKSEWRTANGTHCKSGNIVIQDTNSHAVKQWKRKEPGVVHGAVYRNAFGESVNNAYVVGESFALRKGIFDSSEIKTFRNRSSVFNNPKDSEHHDNRKRMHEISEHCVKKIVEYWKKAGLSWVNKKRTFEVKELMSDLDPEFLRDSDVSCSNES